MFRTLAMIGAAASLALPVKADLFDGLPDPSMDNCAGMWETITGLDYREDASAFLVGDHIEGDFYELGAYQAETQAGNAVATVVGTIQIVDSFPYDWLLPYSSTHNIDDGTNNFDFTMEYGVSAVAVWIDADNGFSSPAVALIADTTIEIVGGAGPDVVVGESATYRIVTPLGFVDDLFEAGIIAERIAAMETYEGPPIDPNADGDPPSPEDGEGSMIQKEAQKCYAAYNSARRICDNNYKGALRKCGTEQSVGTISGCIGGALICSGFPPPGVAPALCCAIGAMSGYIMGSMVCITDAQVDQATCIQNATERLRLCLMVNAGIFLADK